MGGMKRATLVAALVAGCGSSPSAAPNTRPGFWILPTLGIVVTQSDSQTIQAMDPASGETRWRVRPNVLPDPPFGTRFSILSCPPLATLDGKLILRTQEGLVVCDPKDGRTLWKHPLWPPLTCPAVTPDSGVVFLYGKRQNVMKLDTFGNVAWQVRLPLDDTAVSAPQVVAVTGDVLIRMVAHTVSFDATGRLKWTRPAPGEPASEGHTSGAE